MDIMEILCAHDFCDSHTADVMFKGIPLLCEQGKSCEPPPFNCCPQTSQMMAVLHAKDLLRMVYSHGDDLQTLQQHYRINSLNGFYGTAAIVSKENFIYRYVVTYGCKQ